MKKSFQLLRFSKRFFSVFKRGSSKKIIYTQPLLDGQYQVLPSRFVPPEIVRPKFASTVMS